MPTPRIETPSGIVNGMNRIFTLTADYMSGSTRVFLNGVLQVLSFQDGHTELGGKWVRLKEPPLAGDVVRIYYIPIGS